MSNYQKVKTEFERLFEVYKIPKPTIIRKALPTDPCDVTNPPSEVRINDLECEEIYQARHLFGHYLADLHATDDDKSDLVADTIAKLLTSAKIAADTIVSMIREDMNKKIKLKKI